MQNVNKCLINIKKTELSTTTATKVIITTATISTVTTTETTTPATFSLYFTDLCL